MPMWVLVGGLRNVQGGPRLTSVPDLHQKSIGDYEREKRREHTAGGTCQGVGFAPTWARH